MQLTVAKSSAQEPHPVQHVGNQSTTLLDDVYINPKPSIYVTLTPLAAEPIVCICADGPESRLP